MLIIRAREFISKCVANIVECGVAAHYHTTFHYVSLIVGLGMGAGFFLDADVVGARVFDAVNHFSHAAQALFEFPGLLVKRA